MRTAIFQYKCRLCGEIEENPRTAEENALPILIASVEGFTYPLPVGDQPKMTGIHAACKKGIGVTDLIGVVVREE